MPQHAGSDPFTLYILAGGASRRFGSDKARAPVSGEPAIIKLANELGNGAVTVVSRQAGDYTDLGLRTIGDIIPGKGPLGGLLTALEDVGHDRWVFIAACDWRGVRGAWVERLAEARADHDAVLFDSPRKQPLFGLYHASLSPVIKDRIKSDRLKMQDFVDAIEVTWVSPPPGWANAFNMNEPTGT